MYDLLACFHFLISCSFIPDEQKKWVFEQQKLENFEDYILSPHTSIPPGDCIIIEFDSDKEKTDHICETYKVSIERGDLSGG